MPADLQTELDAILHRAAIAPLDDRAFLRVTGSDATRWLNGMVTNSVQALAPGEGCYNFLLNAQGRILGDCTVYREPNPTEPPAFLLETENWQLATVRQHLDHFIIMDDVELAPLEMIGVSIVGPLAHRYCLEVSLPVPGFVEPEPVSLPPLGKIYRSALWAGEQITLISPTRDNLVEIWSSDPSLIRVVIEKLLTMSGAPQASPEALEAFRLLEGRPLYGRDITDKYLPQETNQPHALHFNKGCYLGQEIVERIRSRGQVHRLLMPLTLTGSLPAELPAPLESDGKPAGEITSAALVPLPEGPQLLALGYVRREALDTHAALTYNGGSAAPRNASKH